MSDRDVNHCLFCGSERLEEAFRLKVNHGRYDAPYHRCPACESLQLSRVEWVREVPSVDLQDFDVGAVQRSILCSLLVRALRQASLLRYRARCLDFGAGLGLLVRLLRDQGFDAWGVDRYRRMMNCDAFQVDPDLPQTSLDLVVLVEVFEHLLTPLEDLATIVKSLSPDGMILIKSELYDARVHGPDWTYLRPEWGGHINFPSRRGLTALAKQLGFKTQFLPVGHCLLVRPASIREAQRLIASAMFLVNIALARALGQCNFRHATADSNFIEAEDRRKLHS